MITDHIDQDKKKYMYVFQVSALKKKKLGMVGRHYTLFYRNILYG